MVTLDTQVAVVADALSLCLEQQLARTMAGPVAVSTLVPGQAAIADYCACGDNTGSGEAWVRLVGITPVVGAGVGQKLAIPKCGSDVYYNATLEMGVFRCAPTPDDQGNPPSAADLTDAAHRLMDDAAAMRRAYCCLRDARKAAGYDSELAIAPGAWTPHPSLGGCMGGSMTLSFEIQDNCC
ncbi:hypothetical protein ACEZCY_14185 [Streptacidiphilus sp. N1-12]|uniref:Uncharacterized protein n=2 Tax=Streptacidiphilus alkalitolerans TaxID=3342712 RepID=A0ABV6WEC2_9ACTN